MIAQRRRYLKILSEGLLAVFIYGQASVGMLFVSPQVTAPKIEFQYATDKLWEYLGPGLVYLESPMPLASAIDVSPAYLHPDGVGRGAYGLTAPAYSDVQRHYPFFQDYSWEELISSQELYGLANRAFADLLLKHLQDYIAPQASYVEVFDVLHQAWNLGLTGYKTGREVVASRIRRAEEYKRLSRES